MWSLLAICFAVLIFVYLTPKLAGIGSAPELQHELMFSSNSSKF